MNRYVRGVLGVARAAGALVVISISTVFAQTTQEHVHQMAHAVMPFDIVGSVHVFKMTESGGVLKVIAKDADAIDQIALIQQHLRHQAENFQQGDYTAPATLHGEAMPGLRDLQAGAADIRVSYKELSKGGEISFEASAIHLITAIHRWFGAQLSEHGADARAE